MSTPSESLGQHKARSLVALTLAAIVTHGVIAAKYPAEPTKPKPSLSAFNERTQAGIRADLSAVDAREATCRRWHATHQQINRWMRQFGQTSDAQLRAFLEAKLKRAQARVDRIPRCSFLAHRPRPEGIPWAAFCIPDARPCPPPSEPSSCP